jgi:hypothetical protein
MMTIFDVVGPLEVPFYKGKGGRTIRDEDVDRFWLTYRHYKHRRGCYVFGRRAGKGYTPGYVGLAVKNLGQEVFAHHKLSRYQQFLVEYAKGTPILFFIIPPEKRGKPNATQLHKIEKFLINLGLTANPKLLNQHYTKPENWGIRGVVRGGKGKTAKGTVNFRQMMGITK